MEFAPIIYGPLFVSDAQDVSVRSSGQDQIDVKVSVGETSFVVPVSPVPDGGRYTASLRMREILSSIVPSPGLAEAGEREVPLVTVSAGDASMSFRAVYGAASGKTPVELAGHWLSWRDQVGDTYTWGRERLTFLAGLDLLGWKSGTWSVSVKIYRDGADPVTRTLSKGTLQSGCRYVTVDASYSTIAALVPEMVLAYDISYSFSGTDSVGASASIDGYPLRMVVARRDVRVREFIFCNTFGVEDRVYATGRSNPKLEGTSVSFLSGGSESELRNEAEERKEVFSGYLSSARKSALWLDFLKARDRHVLHSGELVRIIVDAQETDLQDHAIGSVKFTYHLAEAGSGRFYSDAEGLGDFDPGQRFGALYFGKDQAGEELPTEDLFFLKTRLDEFPEADLTEGLLFLVQNPLTEAWGSASLCGILEWIRKTIQVDQVSLWDGPWDAYSAGVADAALSARLGRELFDRIGAIERTPFELPVASKEALGGVRVGEGLTIDENGVLSTMASGFIGTTKVQEESKEQSLTGISDLTMSGALTVREGRIWWDAEKKALRTNCPLITDGDQIVVGGEPGGSGGGAQYLSELLDVDRVSVLSAKKNYVLTYDGTAWIAAAPQGGGTVQAVKVGTTSYSPDASGVISLPAYPSLAGYAKTADVSSAISSALIGYATQDWVAGRGYVTQDALKGYVTIAGDETISGKKAFTHKDGITIGDIRLWQDAETKALRVNAPLITEGDQIVISGGPGGGSAGASYLYELEDVSESVRNAKDGFALVYDGSQKLWVAKEAGAGKGTMNSVTIGSTKYSPDGDGNVTLPAYPTVPTSWAWSSITGKPTTISGYGITDAKIANGAITIGSNSITPLTEHQSLDGYIKHINLGANPATLDSTAGSFAFSGTGEPWPSTDWVGLQIGDNVDKWQITVGSAAQAGISGMQYRQNDSGGTNTASWTAWRGVLDTNNYASFLDNRYVKKSGDTMTGTLNFGNSNIGIEWVSTYLSLFGSDGHKVVVGNGTMRPFSADAGLISLGTSSYRWSNVYSVLLNVSGAATFSSTLSVSEGQIWWDSEKKALRTNCPLITEGDQIVMNGTPGSGSAGATYLSDLLDVSLSNLSSGQALVYRNGKWTNETINAGLDTTQLAAYLSGNNFIKTVAQSGSGNVVTAVTQSGQNVTVTKGITALTASDLANYVTLNTAQTITGRKTFTAYPIIDLTATNLAASTQSIVLQAKYKSNNLTFTSALISVLGSTQTNANNFDVRMGSATGATWISAGENGSHLHEYVPIENNESVWISADSQIKFYTGCSNDGATYTNTVNMSSSSVSPGATNAISLGTSSLRWSNTYTQLLNAAGAATLSSTLSVGGASTLSNTLSVTGATTLGSTLSVKGNTTPGTNNTYSLGTSSLRWSNVYSVLGNFSGQITSSVATGTAPFSVTSTTLVTNLNADMLDSAHKGVLNGNIVARTDFPSYSTFGTATDLNSYIDNILKYVNTTYPAQDAILFGAGTPGSKGILLLHRYNTNTESTTGYPYHSTAMYIGYGGTVTVFGTKSGVSFKETVAYTTSTVAAANTLATARYFWGQSFNGSANVSGNMTGVGSISASGAISTTGKTITVGNGEDNLRVELNGLSYRIGLHLGTGGTNRGLYEFSPSNAWLLYFTSANTVLNYGNVGIGMPSPTHKLHVSGDIYATTSVTGKTFVCSSTTQEAHMTFSRGGVNYIYAPASGSIAFVTNGNTVGSAGIALCVTSASNVVIGAATSTSYKLDVRGAIYSTGDQVVASSSDRDLKDNIRAISTTTARRVLTGLRGVSFDWNDTAVGFDQRKAMHDRHDVGFIAQEVLPLIPEAVTKDYMEKYYRLDKGKILPYVVAGMQGLYRHESEQDKDIAALKRTVAKQAERISNLEKRLNA